MKRAEEELVNLDFTYELDGEIFAVQAQMETICFDQCPIAACGGVQIRNTPSKQTRSI